MNSSGVQGTVSAITSPPRSRAKSLWLSMNRATFSASARPLTARMFQLTGRFPAIEKFAISSGMPAPKSRLGSSSSPVPG